MWKLVKTELSYLLLFIVGGSLLLIATALILVRYIHTDEDVERFSLALFWFCYLVNLVIQVILMYRENFENRIRLQASIPVSNNAVGLARLVVPLIVCIYFLGLWVLGFYILSYGHNVRLYDGFREYVYGDGNIQYTYQMIGMLISITFILRLLTEPIGRILLMSYFALLIVVSILEGFFPNIYMLPFLAYIFYIPMYILGTPSSGPGGLGLAILIFILFKFRRSYLR